MYEAFGYFGLVSINRSCFMDKDKHFVQAKTESIVNIGQPGISANQNDPPPLICQHRYKSRTSYRS